jgi:hypothetical protein
MGENPNRSEALFLLQTKIQQVEEQLRQNKLTIEKQQQLQEDYQRITFKRRQLLNEVNDCWRGQEASRFLAETQEQLSDENRRFFDHMDEMQEKLDAKRRQLQVHEEDLQHDLHNRHMRNF